MLLLILAKLAGVSVPLALKGIVDGLDPSLLAAGATVVVPLAMLIAYGLLRFFSVFLSELRDAVFSRVAERAQRRIGLDVFRHLHVLDLGFHLSRRTGGLSRDMERGVRGVGFILRFALFNIVPIFFELSLVVGILLFNYHLSYAMIALISVLVYVIFSVYTTEWRTGFVRQSNAMDSKANTRAVDSLLNYETVKYFGNEDYEANLYDKNLAEWESARLKNRLSLASLNSGQAFIISGGISSMMVLAAFDVHAGTMSLGDLVLVNAFMVQLFMPLNVLGFVYREIKASLADVETLFGLLETEAKVQDKPNAITLRDIAGGIEFSHVSFSYAPDRQILNNISFSVAPGEKLAIVGRSGSGKSTIARLLFRFYDPSAGEIRVGGKPIAQLSTESLRAVMGVVPQDTVLFNDTIGHNISYGMPGASQSDIEAAAEKASLAEFIQQLPQGYATQVGERGLKISGGEKQRVAIARVILKNPDILIFDEATSSLDSEAESAIISALNRVAQQHTSIIIAHRLSTIIDADRILVLDKGAIIEQGTHDELLALNGLYRSLWELQAE